LEEVEKGEVPGMEICRPACSPSLYTYHLSYGEENIQTEEEGSNRKQVKIAY
jgi:hypothetical protein